MSARIIFGQLKSFNEDALIMAKQLGSTGIHFNRPPIMGDDTWSYEGIKWLRDYCAGFGLELTGIENIPVARFGKIIVGAPGRDEQIEKYIKIIESFGLLGIPLLGHGFAPNFVWRTNLREPARGGALSMSYDKGLVKARGNALTYQNIIEGDPPSREKLWENYAYFIKAVLPAAERYHVKLAVHPSDPPLLEVDGVDRIFISIDDFKKGMEISNSAMWGLNMCLGCFSQMGSEETVLQAIRYFGPRGKIFQVHFRDVQGTGEHFKECFLGEGNFDPAKVLHELCRSGFDGCIIDDHVPTIVNDSRWAHTARANQTGYLQGMIKMLEYSTTATE